MPFWKRLFKREPAREVNIFNAVRSGNIARIRELLKQDPDRISTKTEKDKTLLHLAAESEELQVAEFLLRQGANPNAQDADQWTPLHAAAFETRFDDSKLAAIVSLLLAHGADRDAQEDYGETALHKAARVGNRRVAETLINNGIQIDSRNAIGGTPLYEASRCGSKITDFLISKGADVNAVDKNGNSPLHKAAENGKIDAMRILLNRNADINAENNTGETPLLAASRNGAPWVVQELKERGAKGARPEIVLEKNPCFCCILPLFSIREGYNVYQRCLTWFSAGNGSDDGGLTIEYSEFKHGRTFEHHGKTVQLVPAISISGSWDFTKGLKLPDRVDEIIKNNPGSTILFDDHTIAVRKAYLNGRSEIIGSAQTPLKRKPQPTRVEALGGTQRHHALPTDSKRLSIEGAAPDPSRTLPERLMTAAESGDLEGIRKLLKNRTIKTLISKRGEDVDVNVRGALVLAAELGHLAIIHELLAAKADPNVRWYYGATALSAAARSGHVEIVRTLLDAGAEMGAKNDFDETAFDIAIKEGHDQVAYVLHPAPNGMNIIGFEGG